MTVFRSTLLALCLGTTSLQAASWPANGTGTNIGTSLPAGFENSGVAWDNFTGKLYTVSDGGSLGRMTRTGTETTVWTISGAPDLEAVAVLGTRPYAYLGVEYDSSTRTARILEIPTLSLPFCPGSTTTLCPGKSWNLPASQLPVSASNGMEGLTWVPDGYHPYGTTRSGGVFYASTQQNGSISIFDVDLATSGSTPTWLGTFTPVAGQSDISDLYFSFATNTLFVLYDAANRLVEIDPGTTANTRTATYTLPSVPTGQEGVTTLPQCPGAVTQIYLSQDTGGLYSFANFPQPCAN